MEGVVLNLGCSVYLTSLRCSKKLIVYFEYITLAQVADKLCSFLSAIRISP